MLTEKQFEEHLMMRKFEPASPDFAGRIIAKALLSERSREVGIITYIREMLASLILPKTAFSVLAVLIVGIMIGLSMPVQDGQPQEIALIEDGTL